MKINKIQKGYMPNRVNAFLHFYRRPYTIKNKEEDLRVLEIHQNQLEYPLSYITYKMVIRRLQRYEN